MVEKGCTKKVRKKRKKVLTKGLGFGILIERLTRGKSKQLESVGTERKLKKALDKRMRVC